MSLFKKPETPYDKSKEFLDRQQNIDYLLVLAKLLEPGMNTDADTNKETLKKISKIIEEIK